MRPPLWLAAFALALALGSPASCTCAPMSAPVPRDAMAPPIEAGVPSGALCCDDLLACIGHCDALARDPDCFARCEREAAPAVIGPFDVLYTCLTHCGPFPGGVLVDLTDRCVSNALAGGGPGGCVQVAPCPNCSFERWLCRAAPCGAGGVPPDAAPSRD